MKLLLTPARRGPAQQSDARTTPPPSPTSKILRSKLLSRCAGTPTTAATPANGAPAPAAATTGGASNSPAGTSSLPGGGTTPASTTLEQHGTTTPQHSSFLASWGFKSFGSSSGNFKNLEQRTLDDDPTNSDLAAQIEDLVPQPPRPHEMWELPLWHLAEFLDMRDAVALFMTCKEFWEVRRIAHIRLQANLLSRAMFERWLPAERYNGVVSLHLTNILLDIRNFKYLKVLKINLEMSKKLR